MFTGIDDPYEPPEQPEVTVYTERETVQESIQKIISALLAHNYLKEIHSSKNFVNKPKRLPESWKKWVILAKSSQHNSEAKSYEPTHLHCSGQLSL